MIKYLIKKVLNKLDLFKLKLKIERSEYKEKLFEHMWERDGVYIEGHPSPFYGKSISYKCKICGYKIYTTYTSILHYPSYRPDLSFKITGSQGCKETIMKRALE